MVLTLRIAPALWAKVSGRQPEFDKTLASYLNRNVCWLFKQPDRRYDREAREWRTFGLRFLLATGEFKFFLQPAMRDASDGYDITFLQRLSKNDRYDALDGTEVNDEVVVFPPLPPIPSQPQPVQPREIAFVIKPLQYKTLASHLKAPINLAWGKVRIGRTTQRVFHGDDVLFLLKAKDSAQVGQTSDLLDEALCDAGVGRAINDPYELKKLRELIDKFGETVSDTMGGAAP
jgi:hypothetical protein